MKSIDDTQTDPSDRFRAALHSFKNLLQDNQPLLKDSTRQDLIEMMARPGLAEKDRQSATRLLLLASLRAGRLNEAFDLSDRTLDTWSVSSTLWRFQKQAFDMSELQTLQKHLHSLAEFSNSVLVALLDCLQLDEQGRLLAIQERKMSLLVMGLPPEERSPWRKIQNNLIKNQICLVEMRADERVLEYSGQRLDFASKRSLFQILRVLAPTGRLSLEEAVQTLWQAEMEESYFARLRTAVQRLNAILARVLPLQRAVELNSRELKLAETIKIQIVQTHPSQKERPVPQKENEL